MAEVKVPGIVSCEWLSKALSNKLNSAVKILATDFSEPGSGYKWFLRGHIPMSQYFDMWEGVKVTPFMTRDLPNPEAFENYVQSHGIDQDTHVIIYDRDAMFYAARLWHQFKLFGHKKVSMLDGGLIHWQQLNLPIESGEQQQSQRGHFKVKDIDDSLLASFDDFSEEKCKGKQILDTRLAEDFEGTSEEMSMLTKWGFQTAGLDVPKQMHMGHIPGSVSMGFTDFLDPETYCIISPEKLLQAFVAIGIDPKKPIIGTCYTGTSACLYPLALTKLDLEAGPFQLYMGSWSEYGQKAKETAVEKGTVAKKC